ncbi:glycerophosphodiester phosphodiesterase family protein [Leptospira sp. 96542]|nr:glycerophosphodiester phosphodiesterase family protein [Leptospira sp. 96542]
MLGDRQKRLHSLFPEPMANIGHRGARGLAPENTLVSFLVGGDYTNAFELDTMLCGTGELVVIHDFTVDRTTDGNGLVESLGLRELKSLDAGGFFHENFEGEEIPTLEEVIQAMPEDTVFDIELKSEGDKSKRQQLVEALLKLIHKSKIENRIFVSSFDWELIRAVKVENPEILRGLLIEENEVLNPNFLEFEPDIILPHHKSVTAEFKTTLGEIPIIPYTVNEPKDWDRLVSLGVRGIITDYPDRLKTHLESVK